MSTRVDDIAEVRALSGFVINIEHSSLRAISEHIRLRYYQPRRQSKCLILLETPNHTMLVNSPRGFPTLVCVGQSE